MSSSPAIRDGLPSDVRSIVAVHELAFPGFFLTLLGARFLRELYHAFIREPEGICCVGESEDDNGRPTIVGFAAGTVRPREFYRRLLLRRGAIFAYAALPALFRHPARVMPRLLSAIGYRGERPVNLEGAALLSSLAVSPGASGQGIGQALVDAFCKNAARSGIRSVYLTTDEHGNRVANAFYERAGFRLLGSFTRNDGRTMNTYLRNLDDAK